MTAPDKPDPSPVDDPLLARLGALPAPAPLDDVRAERVRRAAHAALDEERRFAAVPALAPLRRAWSRAVLPALVTGAVGSYLYFALTTAVALYR